MISVYLFVGGSVGCVSTVSTRTMFFVVSYNLCVAVYRIVGLLNLFWHSDEMEFYVIKFFLFHKTYDRMLRLSPLRA
jgi:uncharacterized membrane protein